MGIVGDQNVRRGGVFVDFFGKPAATAREPPSLPSDGGSDLSGRGHALPGFPQRYRVTFEPVEFVPTGDMETGRAPFDGSSTRSILENM